LKLIYIIGLEKNAVMKLAFYHEIVS